MMFQEPALLHQMLSILADNIGDYANFQVRHGRHNNEAPCLSYKPKYT